MKDFTKIAEEAGWPYVSRRCVPLRLALRRSLKERGRICLNGVYELREGMRSYRFTCLLPDISNLRLHLVDIQGRSIKADTIVIAQAEDDACDRCGEALGCFDGSGISNNYGNGLKLVVLATVLPADSCDFFVFAKGARSFFAGCSLVGELAWKRDMMMVNPGNDGLYHEWAEHEEAARLEKKALEQTSESFLSVAPLFSIVTPVFNTKIGFLRELAESIEAQSYENWEHILVNASPDNDEISSYLADLEDERFKVITLEGNRGITGNTKEGICNAIGDYITFVDHDDVLDRFALEEYANVIASNPDVDMLYCDEDSISHDGGHRFHPIFKPEFNADLLLSRNYVIHMLAVSRRAVDKVEIYDESVSGAQDYDLALKVSGVAGKIARVPKVLYHWRQHEDSLTHDGSSTVVDETAFMPSIVALERHLSSSGIDVEVFPHDNMWLYRVAYPRLEERDVVLVVDQKEVEATERLLNSLGTQRISLLSEIVIVGGDVGECRIADERISDMTRFVTSPSANKTRRINEVIRETDAKYVILVDGRVEFYPGIDAIGLLRDVLVRRDVGIASAKTMTLDGLNLHVGLCVKEDGSVGYLNQGFIHGMGGGYNGCAECCCDYSAVASSCIAFSKADFQCIGGLAENYDSRLARDVDFSFRIRELGKVIMVNPDARVRAVADPDALELGASHLKNTVDFEKLWSKWGDSYREDVLANPNYSMSKSFFNLNL